MAKLSGVGIVAMAGGALLLYSAINGKKFSSSVRNILAGQSPSTADTANLIADTTPASSGSSGSTGSSGSAPTTIGESTWITGVLAGIGAPPTQANINSISSWINHEGPYGTQGANNPLNTTLRGTGFTGTFLNTPVSNFDTPGNGIAATVNTLLSSDYTDIVGALRSGNGLCGQSFAGLHTWSGGGYSQVC